MRKIFLIAAVLAIAISASVAMAASGGEGNNTGCNGQGNPNSPCNGNGGGEGGGHGHHHFIVNQNNTDIHNRNYNKNVNTNVNVNEISNVAVASAQQQQGQVQGQKQGQDQGQVQGNENTIQGDTVKVYASAPSVFAPALTSSPETCFGSTSAGASGGNGIFGFGLSFGTTWKSDDCELRMFARSLHTLGQSQAALALLAQNENVANALKAAGVSIPGAK